MKRNSKSTQEIYRAKFPTSKLKGNAYACAKAMGYLECLVEHCPSTQSWVVTEIQHLSAIAIEAIAEE